MTNMTSPGALTSGTPRTGVLAPFLGPPTGTKNMPKLVKRLLLVRVLDKSSILGCVRCRRSAGHL